MIEDLKHHQDVSSHHWLWFGVACFWFTVIFLMQGLMLITLFKSYFVIKNASRTLGIQSKDQTNQLCLMIFSAIMLAMSFMAWYICDNLALFLNARGDMDKGQGLLIEGSARLFRIVC